MESRLVMVTEGVEKIFSLVDGVNTIGRDAKNSVQVLSEKMSRCHAKITCAGENSVLEDLNSSNGTFINGRKISKETLKHGDEVMFADAILKYESGQSGSSDFVPKQFSQRSIFATQKLRSAPTTRTKEKKESPPPDSGNVKTGGFFRSLFRK